MKTTSVFRGAATAIVTPLTASGVDFEAFGRLIDWQIESGINALVIAGTTGEGSTLSDEEHRDVMRFAAERVSGRVPMIAGTGSNDTAYAIDLSKYADSIARKAGVNHLSLKLLRENFIIMCFRSGWSAAEVQAYVGISQPSNIVCYQKIARMTEASFTGG